MATAVFKSKERWHSANPHTERLINMDREDDVGDSRHLIESVFSHQHTSIGKPVDESTDQFPHSSILHKIIRVPPRNEGFLCSSNRFPSPAVDKTAPRALYEITDLSKPTDSKQSVIMQKLKSKSRSKFNLSYTGFFTGEKRFKELEKSDKPGPGQYDVSSYPEYQMVKKNYNALFGEVA